MGISGVSSDLSCLIPAERDVIAYSITFCGEPCAPIWVKAVDLLALTPVEKRLSRQGAYDRLCAPTTRRGAVLERDHWGYYRVIPEALERYLMSKQKKGHAHG